MRFLCHELLIKIETPILMRITGHKKESTFLDFIGENLNRIIKLIYLFSRLALK